MDKNLLEKNKEKANNQLFYIDCKRSKIKKEIYSLFDSYLTIIRSKLQNYLGEAIKDIAYVSNNGINVKDQKTILFIKNDLNKLVNKVLPFLTIEQLSIKREYKIDNQIKKHTEFKSNYNLNEEIYTANNFESIFTNNSLNYCVIYYKNLINKDKFVNTNIDNLLENKSFEYYKKYESIEFTDYSILLNDYDEDKFSININEINDSKYFIPIQFADILLWIDTIQSSLNYYLKDLSIEINNELLKKNILKKFIKSDLLSYVFENNLLFSNPSPFILTFDPTLNQYINFDENYFDNELSNINLINIDSSELEFINIKLSILKNKLLELKSSIYLLIKKETYWSNKLKRESKIISTINKI